MNKQSRQYTIKEILSQQSIASQDDLARALKRAGVIITQATLSRDLREMGVMRLNTADGARYAVSSTGSEDSRLKSLLSYEITSITSNESLVVVRTLAGRAQGVAEQLDAMGENEILATIAGDNTIFIAPRSVKSIDKLVKALRKYIEV
jgi:transcriptional regulator of arginine metabolism